MYSPNYNLIYLMFFFFSDTANTEIYTLPYTTLFRSKIGGHYVRGVADDPVYGTLVKAVNEIGRIMGIVTIAEEVENETILEKLRGLGVGYAQGHAVAPPAPLVDKDGAVTLPHVPWSAEAKR